jgi:hypothetical protein
VALLATVEEREARALDNMRHAIDMAEMLESVSACRHNSFMPHGAIFKTTVDILSVGDVWAFDLSPLEMHNAEAKRTGVASGSRRTTMSTSSQAQEKPSRNSGKEGPAQLVQTKGCPTMQSLSILSNLLVSKVLRQGDGMVDSRRKERLFGATGSGRTSLPRAGAKLDRFGEDYDPLQDSCLAAFVRLMAEEAQELMSQTQQTHTLVSFVFVLFCWMDTIREGGKGIDAST